MCLKANPHVVFTIPHELSWLALQNKKVVYNLLFRCSAATLLEMAADPKHLGAEIGFLSVLHTWGQNLQIHPRVHCVIPAGGLSPDQQRWVHLRYAFFLPVKILSRAAATRTQPTAWRGGLGSCFCQPPQSSPNSPCPIEVPESLLDASRPGPREEKQSSREDRIG
jgi:hypothetical protein